MIVRSSKFLALFFAAALLGIVVIVGVLAWQLSRGPISLSFLTPYVTEALGAETRGGTVRLSDTVLTWAGFERTLDVRALGLEFLDERGAVVASVPEMAVRFSLPAIMRGLLAPTSLELFGPRVKIIRAPDGSLSLGIGAAPEAGGEIGEGLLAELLQPPDKRRSMGYLTRVSVSSALVEVEDRMSGRRWQATRANIALERNARGIRADGQIVLDGDGASARFEVSGLFDSSTGAIDLGMVFDQLRPSVLPKIDARMALLERLALPMDGTITLSLDRALSVTSLSLDIDGGAGTLTVPELYPQPLALDAAKLRVRFVDNLTRALIDEAKFDFPGPSVSFSGEAVKTGETVDLRLAARAENLQVAELDRYWPPGAEPNARQWVVENLTGGVMERARVRVAGALLLGAENHFALSELAGEFAARDVTVHYLRPMPPARGVRGVGRFDANVIVVDIEEGGVGNLRTEGGRFEIHGLSGSSRGETVRTELSVTGPAREALRLLNEEPLGFLKRFPLDPAAVAGDQRTSLLLRFPLLQKLQVSDIEVTSSTRLSGFSAPRAAFGRDLSDGDFALNVDREKLVAEGTGKIAGIPASLVWREYFSDSAPVRTRYDVQTILNDDDRRELGLDLAPLLTGPVGAGLRYTVTPGGSVIGAANLNLTNTALEIPGFGWRKPPGVAGTGRISFAGTGGQISDITALKINAADLSLEGRAMLADTGGGLRLSRLHLARLAFAENDIAAVIEFPAGAPTVVALGGTQLDMRPLIGQLLEDDAARSLLPPMEIIIDPARPLDSVRLGDETRWLGVTGYLRRNDMDWNDLKLRGRLSNAGNVSIAIAPAGPVRRVKVESDDGGGVLRALDWATTIKGGVLRVDGAIMGRGKTQKIDGHVALENFELLDGPVIARILSLATLTGIGDVLGGSGISFRRAEVPFRMNDSEIIIEGAKARGAELGIVAAGRIDRANDTIALEGEVVPAYTLNSIIGNIPLIGTLLSGGSEGIFAATYRVTGTLQEPRVMVNPLSVLTPGIVRRLLGNFGDSSDYEGERGQPKPVTPGLQ